MIMLKKQLADMELLLTPARTPTGDSADDDYCLRLYADYQADTDKGEPMSIESFAKGLGISL